MPSKATVRAVAIIGFAGVAVATLIPLPFGPLAGPYGVTVCTPAGTDRDVYFGQILTNKGIAPLRISTVTGTGENLGAVTFSLDVEGPSLGETIGTYASPPEGDSSESGERVLARAVVVDEAVLAPDVPATLLFHIEPLHPDSPAIVDDLVVNYSSAGRAYSERFSAKHVLVPGDAC